MDSKIICEFSKDEDIINKVTDIYSIAYNLNLNYLNTFGFKIYHSFKKHLNYAQNHITNCNYFQIKNYLLTYYIMSDDEYTIMCNLFIISPKDGEINCELKPINNVADIEEETASRYKEPKDLLTLTNCFLKQISDFNNIDIEKLSKIILQSIYDEIIIFKKGVDRKNKQNELIREYQKNDMEFNFKTIINNIKDE